MTDFTRLIRLLEITRSIPQTGYAISEFRKEELSDLAQHHYLVTAIAWQLGRMVLRAGGTLDLTRVLEFALVHDLGEVFGGDIAMPYARTHRAAKAAAKEFEMRNQEYLGEWFGRDQAYIQTLWTEVMDARCDEALVYKMADYMETVHYKLYLRRLTTSDVTMACEYITRKLAKLRDTTTKAALTSVLDDWCRDLQEPMTELFDEDKVRKLVHA